MTIVVMRRSRPVFALLVAALTGCGGGQDAPLPSSAPTAALSPPAVAAVPPGPSRTPATEGEALYLQYCAACHGADGRSDPSIKSAPHLNGQDLLAAADDAFLYAAIAQGRPGEAARGVPGTKMPAFAAERGPLLTDSQVRAIIGHIRRWQAAPPVALGAYRAEGDAAAGRATYDQHCAVCHGPDGWGVDAPRLAGPVFQATATDAFIRHAIANGRAGSAMAAYAFDEVQMGDLIAFIRTLDDVPPTPR
ncbi:hypothetical protein DCC79_01590 [bacterium]|nr:hypothetical protein [Chloroflexi bacterium CFX6]RIL12414.1 MAG: hypothetical protein DCC79_01590 [bacterium]